MHASTDQHTSPRGGRDAVSEPGSELGKRIVRGSVWTAARQGVTQAASLLSLVVVARLVPPSEVGLFSLATLVLSITRALTETGLETALIHKSELDERTLDVGFCLVLLRSLFVSLLVAAGAGLFASFFSEPRVADLLRVLALGLCIEGFVNNRVAMLQRDLDFRGYFFFHTAGQCLGLAVTIASAFLRHDVWAVVYGQIAGAGGRVLASYLLVRRHPRLTFDWAITRELFRYGRWVSASSILLFALVNGDNVFIGKLIGATALAYYAWAYQLANLPGLFVTQILSSVMFPALSLVRDDPARLGSLFLRSMRLTWLLSLPSTVFIAVLVEPFTRAVLGERWLPIVPITHSLACFGLLRAVGASASALFLAVGRPDLRAKLQIAQLSVFACSVYPLYVHYGVSGVALSVTLYGLTNVASAYWAFRLCALPLSALGWPSVAATLATLAGATAAYLCARALWPHAWFALIAGSVGGVLVTLLALLRLDPAGEVSHLPRMLGWTKRS
jgi:lipopolysaccharide exporter